MDPLVDRDCHYLDGKCDCRSIEECKYNQERTIMNEQVNTECEVASNAEIPPGLSKEEIEKLKRQQEKARQLAEGEQPKEAEQPVE